MLRRSTMLPYILRFKPNLRQVLWGTEDWVVSAHPKGSSVIANGEFAGKTLRDVWPDFPLLFKVIDAHTCLSVQVHPNEQTCLVTGGEPKTEMWCLLNDGVIYAGLKPGTGARDVEEAVRSGAIEDVLVRHEAKAGDVFFIPGGLVHTIGDNTRLYEVQQSSDTTFRLYDWGRVGADGRPRQLHIAESLKAIGYGLPAPRAAKGVSCPFFRFAQEEVTARRTLDIDADFAVLYAMKGPVAVEGRTLAEGESALVTRRGRLTVEGTQAHLFVTLPGEGL